MHDWVGRNDKKGMRRGTRKVYPLKEFLQN